MNLETDLIPLLSALVAINSINPTLSGGPGEKEIATFCARWLQERGVSAKAVECAPGRCNVYAVIPGRGKTKPILLNSHLDTVGVEGMEAPFTLGRDGIRALGRGAYDMKASVALEMLLAVHFAHNPPPGDLYLTLVADEEDVSLGMEALVRDWLPTVTTPGGAIVLEPTEEGIGLAHKGFGWLEVTVRGRAAHGSRPKEGIDAICRLGSLLVALNALQHRLETAAAHPMLGHGSVHASTVQGGSAWSIYPASATLRYERRTLPGTSDTDLLTEIDELLAEAGLSAEMVAEKKVVFTRPPLMTERNATVVQRLRAATSGEGDDPSEHPYVGLPFWTDGALLGAAGLLTVIYGPIGGGAHADVEWVELPSVLRVYEAVRQVIAAGIA
jgi:acetylornithine deacetylase